MLKSDLKRLLRSPENILAMVLFGALVLLVIHFSLPPAHGRTVEVGSGALWVALLLSGVLGLPPLQHEPDAIRFLPQLLTSAATSGLFFWEKLTVGFGMLSTAAACVYPVAMVLFGFPPGGPIWTGFGVVLLGALGTAAVITLCTALTVQREAWLLSVLVFPLLLPVALSGSRVLSDVLLGESEFAAAWLRILIAYDVLMVLGGWFLSEFLWEELPH